MVLDGAFPWYYTSSTVLNEEAELPWYSHPILSRPRWDEMSTTMSERKYPKVCSPYIDKFYALFEEIRAVNRLRVNCLLRMNVNCTEPRKNRNMTLPHFDHEFPHYNLIVYFTNTGGDTLIVNPEDQMVVETFEHSEDDIVLFDGGGYPHCQTLPKERRRVVLVMTYI